MKYPKPSDANGGINVQALEPLATEPQVCSSLGSFEKLPAEILHRILRAITYPDIRKFKMVNHPPPCRCQTYA